MRNEATPEDLRNRTRRFAVRTIGVCDALGERGKAGVISRQLVRCGTSVGAQFREAKRSRSNAEFLSKIESASQELDETIYWLELVIDCGILKAKRLAPLLVEANEIMSILVAAAKTIKGRMNQERKRRTR